MESVESSPLTKIATARVVAPLEALPALGGVHLQSHRLSGFFRHNFSLRWLW